MTPEHHRPGREERDRRAASEHRAAGTTRRAAHRQTPQRDAPRAPAAPRARGGRAGARRRPNIPAIAALALLALLVAGLVIAVPVWTVRRLTGPPPPEKTPSAVISVTPTAAVITLGKLKGAGELKTGRLEPGTYPLRIALKGFETLAATFTVAPDKPTVAKYALKGLPQKLKVTAHPSKARITATPAGAAAKNATGKLDVSLAAGPVDVTVSAPGYGTLKRRLLLDAPLTLDLWLDPVGQLVRTVSAFKCVPAPKGVAVTPDGSQMWVTALVTQPSIEAYDRAGTVIGKVNLGGNGAVEVVFNKDGTRAYASQMQSASVYEIDTKTYKVLRKFGTQSSWTKVIVLSPDEKLLYAANWSGDDVSVIDLATGKCVKRYPTVDTPRGLWPTADGKQLWVAGFGEQSHVGRIAVIDLETGKGKTIFSQQGGAMRHMVADEKRGIMLTSDMGKACVWQTDMKTLKTKRLTKTDSHPNTIDLSPDGRVLFVSCRGANNPKSYYIPGPEWGTILLFDAMTGKPLDAIIGGNQCTALDLSSDGRTLVFSDFLDNRLHVYDIPADDVLLNGKGGRYAAHFDEIRKPGWSGGGSSGGGD